MEILEAYCRTVLVASQLGKPVKTMSTAQLQDLLKIKQNLGIPDPRYGLKECELCDNERLAPGRDLRRARATPAAVERERRSRNLVQAVTDQILARLSQGDRRG